MEEGINAQKLELIDELTTADYAYHGPGQEIRGRDGIKAMIGGFFAASPDMRTTIDDLVAVGDRVVTRFTVTGTHRGPPMGVAPSGRRVTLPVITISRLAGGRIAEDWEVFDRLALLEQIGAGAGAAAGAA